MTRCSQCYTHAMFHIEGFLLCLNCMFKYKEIQRIDFNMNASIANKSEADISSFAGLRLTSPPIQLIPGNRIGDQMTYHNINVNQSTIGVLNTGFIKELDNNMTVITGTPSQEVVENLKAFTEALVQDDTLTTQQKDEALEYLATISNELAAPPEQRKVKTVRLVLNGLANVINASAGLATLWQTFGPQLTAFFS